MFRQGAPALLLVLLLRGLVLAQDQLPGREQGGDEIPPQFVLFCPVADPPTLRQELALASLVVAGSLRNPAMNPANDERTAVTDLIVQRVVKAHPFLGDRKVLTIPRYIPIADPKKPPRYLLFCDVFEGKLDPYNGIPASDALLDYVRDLQRLDPKQPEKTLLFFVRHLPHAESVVAEDASREVSATPYPTIRASAGQLPAEMLAALVARPKPDYRQRLSAFLLGHCGNDRHAALLEKQIQETLKQDQPQGLIELLIGYTLLRPKEGLTLLRGILSDPKKSFNDRYAALKALRFFWDLRREVLPIAEILAGVTGLLDQSDIADIAIEELRTHKEVRQLERILALCDRPGFEAPVNRHAIVRYALTFKEKPAAARFIEQIRANDPEMVKNIEELLKLEAEAKKQPGG